MLHKVTQGPELHSRCHADAVANMVVDPKDDTYITLTAVELQGVDPLGLSKLAEVFVLF